jgi:hypothetical protein
MKRLGLSHREMLRAKSSGGESGAPSQEVPRQPAQVASADVAGGTHCSPLVFPRFPALQIGTTVTVTVAAFWLIPISITVPFSRLLERSPPSHEPLQWLSAGLVINRKAGS